MQRRTITEKGQDEEEDRSPNQSGQLIGCYDDLASSEQAAPSLDQSCVSRHDRRDSHGSPSLQQMQRSEKSSLSMSRKHHQRKDGPFSRTGKNLNHPQLISTGNRLNDVSRIDDYQSRRDNRVNINSFLNSYGERSSFLQEDRLRAFSKQNHRKRQSPPAFELPPDLPAKPIDLITIPEMDPEAAQFEYLQYLNRHRKIPRKDDYFRGLISISKRLQQQENAHSSSFQQAKFKFYDRFMPQPLKIGRNPYRLLQYNQSNRQWRHMLDRL